MERDETEGRRPQPRADQGGHEATPDSATWDVQENAEIELLGTDHEPVDVVDLVDERWAPGQPAPGVPEDEVLHVQVLTEREAPADDLDMDQGARDRLMPAPDKPSEGE